jgi:hypothetical protein
MTHPYEQHIDKLTAIIAKRDERIVEQDARILQLICERDKFRTTAETRYSLRRELEELVGLDDRASYDPAVFETAIRTIAGWKAELRRRIESERDNEIGTKKLVAGWAWAASTEKVITDRYANMMKELGVV